MNGTIVGAIVGAALGLFFGDIISCTLIGAFAGMFCDPGWQQ